MEYKYQTDALLRHRQIETPIGDLLLVASPHGLVRLDFDPECTKRQLYEDGLSHESDPDEDPDFEEDADRYLDMAEQQIGEYFRGVRRSFALVLDLHPMSNPWVTKASAFYQEVQIALQHIPYGEVASYGEIADLVGHPRSARAVGTACSKTPLPLVLPCHRVVKSGGELGGYGGRPETKKWLIEFERKRT